mgnify:CR=1 FL=1
MDDNSILQVVRPSAAELVNRRAFYDDVPVERRSLPPVEEWRLSPSVGCSLSDSKQVVRSNHFLLKTRGVPQSFFHYHVHIYSFDNQSGEFRPEDISSKEDYRVTVALVAQFRDRHPEFAQVNGQKVGFVYDNRNCVVTTHELPLPPNDEAGKGASLSEEINLLNSDGSPSRKRFRLTLTFANTVAAPQDTREGWASNTDTAVMRSLDLSLLAFARLQLKDDAPSWYLVGNKCFSENAASVPVAPGYLALRGYTVGLKTCLAGLTLVSDMTVSVFLVGGPLINVIAEVCGTSIHSLQKNGVDRRDYAKVNKILKNCKIRVDHLVSKLRKEGEEGRA